MRTLDNSRVFCCLLEKTSAGVVLWVLGVVYNLLKSAYIIVKQNVDFCFTACYTKITKKEVAFMAQTMVNFRMDEDLKKGMEQACKEMGLSMTTAFTMFASKVSREKRIPFEVSVDPFYSESNINYLRSIIADIESGKAKLVEHDLIED